MKPDPCGPEIIVRQLQFEFDDIAPLSLEQRLHNWLQLQDEETREVYTALLFLGDNDSRRRRAERWSEIRHVQNPYEFGSSWLVSGGIEVMWLYEEACRDYINGAYFSALLCAHSACERVLAGCLFAYREELPKGWSMWGLGRLIPSAVERNLIDSELESDLNKLTEIRKVAAHFKVAHETTNSVQWRSEAFLTEHPDLEYEDAVNSIMRSDALFAIEAATAIVRGNLGFNHPWV